MLLNNEDVIIYEGFPYDVDGRRKEDLPFRFKRLEQGNDLVQLKEAADKETLVLGRRFNLLKDNNNGDCIHILGVATTHWVIVSQGRIFVHTGTQGKQIRCAALFSTAQAQNNYLQCEEGILKISQLVHTVNYAYTLPFQRRLFPTSVTKLALMEPAKAAQEETKTGAVLPQGEDETYLAAVFRDWQPISFQVSSLPQALKQQGSTLLIVTGEKFRYSIATVRARYGFSPISYIVEIRR